MLDPDTALTVIRRLAAAARRAREHGHIRPEEIARLAASEGCAPAAAGVPDVRSHELDCSHMDVLSPEHANEVVPLIVQALDQEGCPYHA